MSLRIWILFFYYCSRGHQWCLGEADGGFFFKVNPQEMSEERRESVWHFFLTMTFRLWKLYRELNDSTSKSFTFLYCLVDILVAGLCFWKLRSWSHLCHISFSIHIQFFLSLFLLLSLSSSVSFAFDSQFPFIQVKKNVISIIKMPVFVFLFYTHTHTRTEF